MNFLLDNDVPEELSYLLDHLGHRISRVRGALSGDASDAAVLDYAFRHDLIVITCNRDDFLQLARATSPRHRDRDPAKIPSGRARGPAASR